MPQAEELGHGRQREASRRHGTQPISTPRRPVNGKNQTMYLQRDPLVDELKRLAPEVSIRGGSFAHWLPGPQDVLSAERVPVVERARRKATATCLTNLLESAGLSANEPGHLASGARDWPPGYTGSVSHKGTKVVAGLSRISHVRSVGIDIETLDRGRELLSIKGLIASDELPLDWGVAGSVILLSVKEAVFKALNPVLGVRFGYDNVRLSWKEVAPQGMMNGVAHFDRIAVEVCCTTAVRPWVGSVALLSQQPELPQRNV